MAVVGLVREFAHQSKKVIAFPASAFPDLSATPIDRQRVRNISCASARIPVRKNSPEVGDVNDHGNSQSRHAREAIMRLRRV